MEIGIPKNIYREHLIELYKSPSNYGSLEKPTHQATEHNSLCGDEITMSLIVKKDKIEDIKFEGSGCVMSIVSSSMLTDKIKGMTLKDVKKLSHEDILEMLKIKLNPTRTKCALLPLEAVRKALGK
jgi:nitrogen fixation NifU-like protein